MERALDRESTEGRAPCPEGARAAPLTFMFADAESFTQLTESAGDEAAARCIEQFHAAIAAEAAASGGAEDNRMGDLVFLVFARADDALCCARRIQARLSGTPETVALRCRIGLHTGAAFPHDDTYIGTSVNKAARIAALARGGQILLSEETYRQLAERDDLAPVGKVRLRGLDGLHMLYRYGAGAPAETGAAAGAARRNAAGVAEAATAFIGREALVRQVGEALAAGRLVVLIGPSGIGKTRVAREALRRALGEGRFVVGGAVELSRCVDDPDAFESAARAQAHGVLEASDARRAPALLVLDSFEAVQGCAARLPRLLAAQPGLSLLVTSTRPLDLGEVPCREIVVPPMEVQAAPGDEGPESESLALYRQRAREWGITWEERPEDRGMAETVCALLEGIPLAIELAVGLLQSTRLVALHEQLAAARLDVLEAPDLERWAPRHAALRGALSYSLSHLDALHRRVLLRCAVLGHDFTPETAAALCEEEDPGAVAGALEGLARRGLLQPVRRGTSRRVSMLDSVREFALEQLGELRGRYEERAAGYYLRLGEEDSDRLLTGDQVAAFHRLQEELPHLRAGMDWSQQAGKREWVARYALLVWPVLLYRGLTSECEARLRSGIAAAQAAGDRALACKLLCRLSGPLERAERAAELESVCRAGLALAEELEEASLAARFQLSLGIARARQGDAAAAREDYAASLRRYQALGEEWGYGQVYEALGLLELEEGRCAAAAAAFDQALAIVRRRRDRWSEQRLLARRGQAALRAGERPAALELLTEAVRLAEELGDSLGFSDGHLEEMVTLAQLAREAGQRERARWALALCLAAARQLDLEAPAAFYFEAGELARLDGHLMTARAFFADGLVCSLREGRSPAALANLEALARSVSAAERARLEAALGPVRKSLRRGEAPPRQRLREILEAGRAG